MKKKNPDGEKCERKLPFKLSDEDKARKAELAAQLNKQLEAAEEAKKAEMAKHNEKIKKLRADTSTQLKMIAEGIERREVTCVEFKNYEKNLIEWYFEGEVLESREMKPEDRQQSLDENKKGKGKKAAAKPEKWQRMAPKHRPKTDPEEETREEQIGQVHKLETSRKGARSAVDPSNSPVNPA